jgi:hypothetical protein
MPGGLMQLVSEGQQNIILNGNPTKTFFKSTYSKYTNFGLQKFRVDFDGSKTLRMTEESTFTFKIPRYADLLMDCYLSVTLPNIWSPIMPPSPETNEQWAPYDFKWIEYIGAQMISNVTITCGNQTLQTFSGSYLLNSVLRDFSFDKKKLFNEMIGHVSENYNPANSGTRINSYPSAYYTTDPGGAEPSIRGNILYIPLNSWFQLKTQMAFPLVSLQYNELHVNITIRPIQELFQIRDVFDYSNQFPYVAPNLNLYYMQFYRFLQTPPDIELGVTSYLDTRTLWNADVHLICTYGFLSNEESRLFALQEQKYLFKQVREQVFHNITGSNRISLDSLGMISNWMFYFQRSDVNLRNEWSNYTNWAYSYLPNDLIQAPTAGNWMVVRNNDNVNIGPGVNTNGFLTGWMITGNYNFENTKNILVSMGILLDGIYRENQQPAGVYNYIEKYTRTSGSGINGLYLYNFCMNSSNLELQPSGAMNMNRFTNIELETVTITPPVDPNAQSLVICDPQSGNIVGINKPTWRIYDYNFNMIIYEERYNVINFVGGNCGLLYAT